MKNWRAKRCKLCKKRPAAVYLARRINKWVCWPCMQQAVIAVRIGRPIYRQVMSQVKR